MNTSGLLQSKPEDLRASLTLQENQSVHDYITDQKLNLFLKYFHTLYCNGVDVKVKH